MVDRAVNDLSIDVRGRLWWATRGGMCSWAGRSVRGRCWSAMGCGAAEEMRPPDGVTADAVVDNLAAAASWILGHPQRPRNPQRRRNPQ
jgi:hypothetical protein